MELDEIKKRVENGDIRLSDALARALPKFHGLVTDDVLIWCSNELQGYTNGLDYYQRRYTDLPKYRVVKGVLKVLLGPGRMADIGHPLAERTEYFLSAPMGWLEDFYGLPGELTVVDMPELTNYIGKQSGGNIICQCTKGQLLTIMTAFKKPFLVTIEQCLKKVESRRAAYAAKLVSGEPWDAADAATFMKGIEPTKHAAPGQVAVWGASAVNETAQAMPDAPQSPAQQAPKSNAPPAPPLPPKGAKPPAPPLPSGPKPTKAPLPMKGASAPKRPTQGDAASPPNAADAATDPAAIAAALSAAAQDAAPATPVAAEPILPSTVAMERWKQAAEATARSAPPGAAPPSATPQPQTPAKPYFKMLDPTAAPGAVGAGSAPQKAEWIGRAPAPRVPIHSAQPATSPLPKASGLPTRAAPAGFPQRASGLPTRSGAPGAPSPTAELPASAATMIKNKAMELMRSAYGTQDWVLPTWELVLQNAKERDFNRTALDYLLKKGWARPGKDPNVYLLTKEGAAEVEGMLDL